MWATCSSRDSLHRIRRRAPGSPPETARRHPAHADRAAARAHPVLRTPRLSDREEPRSARRQKVGRKWRFSSPQIVPWIRYSRQKQKGYHLLVMRIDIPSPRTLRVTLAAALTLTGAFLMTAQNRLAFSPVAKAGHVALGLALRKLSVSGVFMQAPAHPDDETNALFAYFGYGMGLRVIDLQNNRGDGGQNEIGPERFRDMAILRT